MKKSKNLILFNILFSVYYISSFELDLFLILILIYFNNIYTDLLLSFFIKMTKIQHEFENKNLNQSNFSNLF